MDGTVPSPKKLAFSSQKGGVGKTTTTLNVAAQLAMWGSRVVIIDFDPQAQVTAGLGLDVLPKEQTIHAALTLFNMNLPVDLGTYLLDRSDLIRDAGGAGELYVIGTNTETMAELSDWVSSSRRSDKSMLLATTCLRRFVDQYLQDVDYVLFDTPPTTNQLNALALAASDYVVGVAESKYASYSGVVALYEQTQLVPSSTGNTCHPVFLGTLLNETPSKKTRQAKDMRTMLGGTADGDEELEGLTDDSVDPPAEDSADAIPAQADGSETNLAVFDSFIGASELISGAYALGQPAVLLHPNRQLAEHYGGFTTEVFQRIEEHRAFAEAAE